MQDTTINSLLDYFNKLIPLTKEEKDLVCAKFDLARATISGHVKILQECGLLVIEQKGRERYCRSRLAKLSKVANWVMQYEQHWNSTLDSLEEFLGKERNSKVKEDNKHA